FAHVFLGTSHPWRSRLGVMHGRFVWGALRQSPFAPAEQVGPRRFMAGWIFAYLPPGLEELELGAARFYHLPWPASGEWADRVIRPFEALLVRNVDPDAADANQLASVFWRWIFPTSGFEVYAEYAREDHSYRFR